MADLARESSGVWKPRVSEAVVIVASILLAFAIDAWWEGRGQLSAEEDILQAAAAEVQANRVALSGDLQVHDGRLELIDRFLRASPGEFADLPEDSVFEMIRAFANAPSFNPRLEAISVLAQASTRTRRGREARLWASRVLRSWDEAQEAHQILGDVRSQVREQLAPYALESATEGRGSIPRMVARGGTDTLFRLRDDGPFLATLLQKSHVQGTYRVELASWLVDLDSMSVALPVPRPDGGAP